MNCQFILYSKDDECIETELGRYRKAIKADLMMAGSSGESFLERYTRVFSFNDLPYNAFPDKVNNNQLLSNHQFATMEGVYV